MSDETKDLTVVHGGDIALPDLPDIPQELQTLSGAFLPYMLLVQGLSPANQPPHSIPQGNFAIRRAKGQYDNVTSEVDAYIIHRRMKAMFYDQATQKVKTVYDHESDEFKDMAEKADIKVQGYSWGFEYLFFLPEYDTFLTYFASSKSARISAQKSLETNRRKKVTIFTHQVEAKGFKFWAFQARACSVADAYPYDAVRSAQLAKEFDEGILASEEDTALADAPLVEGGERAR